LRGVDFYKQALRIFERSGSGRIAGSIQTNGTLLGDEFADFIVEHDLPCGFSIDGPEDIHNANRMGADEGSFRAAMMGVEKLRVRGRKCAAITVVTKISIPHMHAIYDFFNGEEMNFKTNPVDLIGRSRAERERLEITPAEYGRALTTLFDSWFDDQNSKITISNLFDAMRSLATGTFTECLYSNRACGGSYLGIAPNGDVYPCNRFSAYPAFRIGNLLTQSLTEIQGHSVFADFNKRSESLAECTGCEFRPFCNGGCSSRAYSYHQTVLSRDWYCPSIKMIFKHVRQRLEKEVADCEASSSGR
jgi:uncharacterized protein